ncbi:MAG: 50S ribosomal protein L10 [Solobacterium sp.]|jgi:large subunit ribosomal protein L10|nr:50S ribosomal protein L10 [Solobacterium sp.]MCH4222548.1 50S ribosomal protein L10 [Solobacterium sp.]MCH4265480.1 50S ribosomal protein L10 [Solobacterium sp.]
MNQAVLESKKNVVSEITDKFKNASSAVVAEYRGLSVSEVTELRRALLKDNVEMKVYKNTLAAKAADEAGFGDLKNVLTGPNAIAFGEDETAAARVMAQFAKKHKALVLKGGIVEGKVIDVDAVNQLAALPNREGMYSMFLSVLQAPITSVARAFNALAEKKGTDAPAAAEAAPEEPKKEEAAPTEAAAA